MSLRVDVVGDLGAEGAQVPLEGPGTRLFEGTLVLGSLPLRMPSLTLDSPQVDHEHAEIYQSDDDGAWHIRDLGSARGTWILPVTRRIQDIVLHGTSTLALGDTLVRISVLPDG